MEPVDLTSLISAATKLQKKLTKEVPLPGKIDNVSTFKVGGRSSKKRGVVVGRKMIVMTGRAVAKRRSIERKVDGIIAELGQLFGMLQQQPLPTNGKKK